MMEDLEKSMKAILYDRLTSPLIGSYITAWCCCNYKIFLIILFEEGYSSKVQDIDLLFYNCWAYLWRYGLPLLWTVFYIFIYPCLAKKVFKRWQQYIKEKGDIKHEVHAKKCLTIEQSRALEKKLADKSVEFEKLTSNKSAEIQRLTERNAWLEKKNDELSEQIKALEQQQTASSVQMALIERNKLQYNEQGLLTSTDKDSPFHGKSLCPKCFNETPPKLSPLNQFNVCNVCGNNYQRGYSKRLSIKINEKLGCWQDPSGHNVCPSCLVNLQDYDYARLLKDSDGKYICPVCKAQYLDNQGIQE